MNSTTRDFSFSHFPTARRASPYTNNDDDIHKECRHILQQLQVAALIHSPRKVDVVTLVAIPTLTNISSSINPSPPFLVVALVLVHPPPPLLFSRHSHDEAPT